MSQLLALSMMCLNASKLTTMGKHVMGKTIFLVGEGEGWAGHLG